jgi:hypothetical protein
VTAGNPAIWRTSVTPIPAAVDWQADAYRISRWPATADGTTVATTVKRMVGVEDLGDLRDDAARRVNRQPTVAVGGTFGVGLLVGVLAAWIGSGRRRLDDLPV